MLSTIGNLFSQISNLFKWYFTILPWEEGLRVRWGKHIKKLGPGVHLRIPLLHVVYKQSVRMRRVDMPLQTVTSKDGKTITLAVTLGYAITDVGKLYSTLHQPDGTLANLVQSKVSQYITTHTLSECEPQLVEAAVSSGLDFSQFGLGETNVTVTDFAVVKTFRLIQDQRWLPQNLDTNRHAMHAESY